MPPPTYMRIRNFRDCIYSHFTNPENTHTSVCLPEKMPKKCLPDSWSKLKKEVEIGKLEDCNASAKPIGN